MSGASIRHGRAFAPAHVTGIFVPQVGARDPRARGSVGAGIVLDIGITAEASWDPRGRAAVRVRSSDGGRMEISEEVARRLLASGGGRLSVTLQHALPVGQGFGSSAAGALATGLAGAAALGGPRGRAVELAHLADLYGRGGLGGVAAILGGGLELRLRPGIPPFGRIVHRPLPGPLLIGTVGPRIRSPAVLGDPARLRRFASASDLFEELAADPVPEAFWDAAERFTDRVGLASPRLRTVLLGLRRRGARAAQAMFGESFLASPASAEAAPNLRRWLTRAGVPVRDVSAGRRGARVLPAGRAGNARVRPSPAGAAGSSAARVF